jgi:hypothetical protein
VVRLWITGANANGLKYITRGSYTGCTRNSRGKPTRDWFLSLSLSLSFSLFLSNERKFPKAGADSVVSSARLSRECGNERADRARVRTQQSERERCAARNANARKAA